MNVTGLMDDDIFDLLGLPELPPSTSVKTTPKEIKLKLDTLLSTMRHDQFEEQRRPLTTRIINALCSQEVGFWKKNKTSLGEVLSAFLQTVPPKEREEYLAAPSISLVELTKLQQISSQINDLLTSNLSQHAASTKQQAELLSFLLDLTIQQHQMNQNETKSKELVAKITALDPTLLQKISDAIKLDHGASLQKELDACIKKD